MNKVMVDTVYYEKIDNQYYPVSYYSSDLSSSFREGSYLVTVHPYSKEFDNIEFRKIEPALLPIFAAFKYAEHSIASKLGAALQDYKLPKKKELTAEQVQLWKTLAQSLGKQDLHIYSSSAHDAVRAGYEVIEQEVNKMMQNKAVKAAYENFMMVWKLTKDNENETINS